MLTKIKELSPEDGTKHEESENMDPKNTNSMSLSRCSVKELIAG